jgi:hypothetical protein
MPIIKMSRGSRGFSSTNFSKNNIGLNNVENKSSSAIRSEITVDATTGKLIGIGTSDIIVNNEKTFGDTRFTAVQTTANSANTTANSIEGRFSSGKLLESNLESGTITKITNGNSAHSDLNQADISIDVTGKIQFNRGGSRGSSAGATITKSHIGLPLAENKSSFTIVGEAFADARFTNVSASARDGFSSGSAARNFFDNSGTPQLKDINTPLGLKNSNISLSLVGSSLSLIGAGGTSATFTNSTVGLGNVENKNVSTIKTETFSDSRFTTVSGNTNTVYNRFDNNGRLLETNSLNNLVKYLSPGQVPSSSPQEYDQVFLAGTAGAVGYSLTYGSKNYNFSNFPNSSFFGLANTSISPPVTNNFLNIYTVDYLKSEFSTTSVTTLGSVNYLIGSGVVMGVPYYNKEYGIISNNSSFQYLTFNNLFYGPIYIEISYNPVKYNGSYWTSENYNGTGSTSTPQFLIETRADDSTSWIASSTAFLDNNNNNISLGSTISSTDGIKTNSKKLISKTENLSGFNQIRIKFDSVANTAAFAIDNIKITTWFRNVDADALSKLYQLATNANYTFTFTGQHKSHFIGNNSDIKEGLIVSSFGEYDNVSFEEYGNELRNKPTIDEAVPKVTLSSVRKDKKAFGIISKKSNNSKYSNPIFPENGLKTQFLENRYEINSLGEGGIWVCNINGNLENGDYITTCEIAGYGMKQDDDLLHNYTVAKITCDCNFDLNNSIYVCEEFEFNGNIYKRAFVGCTYHCG